MKSLIRFLLASLMLLSISSVYGGTIKGKITDATSGESLIGANVTIVGTSLGAASDKEGRYSIQNVPIGVHTVRFSYIGYNEVKHTITITKLDQTVILDAKMEMGVIVGKEFIVSAQAVGQLSAINQQLSAPAMMNVVDAARIRELPDQNAAEAISRLPGVTISRNNGEGSGVGIRGLAPQYNQIQIDGVTMSPLPNMGRAGEFGDAVGGRGISLSSVSQENLSGIEVFKAILPDMDAATLGGTVNMRLGRAPSQNSYDVKVFGAYNGYEKDWKNYKLSAKATDRFFDGALGIQLSVDAEGRNRGNDRLQGSIIREETKKTGEDFVTSRYRVDNPKIINTRVFDERKGFNAILDYATEGTELLFSNSYYGSARAAREINRDKNYLLGASTDSKTFQFSSSLRGAHKFTDLELEWQFSHNKSKTETPDDYQLDWNILTTGSSDFNKIDVYNITPEDYIKRYPKLEGTNIMDFRKIYQDYGAIDETKAAAKLDLKYSFNMGEVSGFVKTGVLLRQSFRTNWLRHLDTFNGRFSPTPMWNEFATDYNPDPVLNGLTAINLFFDVNKIRERWPGILADPFNTAKYDPLKTDNKDFEMKENYYAGYVMMKFNALNEMITFMPGFRYEGDDFDALGHFQYVVTSSTENYDGRYEERLAKRKHGFFLPMMHLKIKPADWFDVRLAVTKTISRPNSLYLVPFVSVSYLNSTVTVGNPDLKTAESWNYDVSFSMYDGKLGLITLSGFYKELTNFSYRGKFFLDSLAVAVKNGYNPFEPQLQSAIVNTVNKTLDIPINTPGISTVKGFEIDYQANFMFLPGLLKHLVFNANYTHIWSKSRLRNYRVQEKKAGIDANGDYFEKLIYDPNPTREGPLQTQPDHILNVSLGYDIGGFSARVSAFYQGRSLSGVGDTELGDSYISGYLRYDMSMRYRFNENISFLLTGVNLTSTPDISTLSGTDKHSSYAVYGTMYDFGVQLSF